MAIKTILLLGDPRLTQAADPVMAEEIGSEWLTELVKDLFDTMRAGGGIGLAAPQIGVSRRVFVMDAPNGQGNREQPMVFINPLLLETIGDSKEMVYEGCLSLPGIREQVSRYKEVVVLTTATTHIDYWQEPSKDFMHRTQLTDLEAQCAQHEIEHLDGRLLIDHFKPSKQARLREQFQRSLLNSSK